jgi:DNA-directed RNA polymerase specialized sigma24 family protein
MKILNPGNPLTRIEAIPLVKYESNSRHQNSGAKRLYQANIDDASLSYEEKYLIYLVHQLGWTYEAIAQRIGCKRQSIHKQYKRIAISRR